VQAYFRVTAAIVLAGAVLGACQKIGPGSIALGRLNYNEVIQETSKVQTFANIVRAYNHEPTAFMDVTQISATVLGQMSLSGAIGSIGAATGKLGSVNIGPLEYQESPTIQYQPLLGQALATQVSTPISPDSLANLFDSNWPFASLLTLSVDRITPGYRDYFPAIDALISLDQLGAIVLTSEAIVVNDTSEKQGSGDQSKTSIPVLAVNLETKAPRIVFDHKQMPADANALVSILWSRFLNLISGSAPIDKQSKVVRFRSNAFRIPVGAPVGNLTILRTRSALGVLQWAFTQPDPLFAVIDKPLFDQIRGNLWNVSGDECNNPFYTLTPEQESLQDGQERPDKPGRSLNRVDPTTLSVKATSVIQKCLLTIIDPAESVEHEGDLFALRRFMLIIKSTQPPVEPYVAYNDGKFWYHIASDDVISQRNFLLVSQILTIQAAPPAPLPLTPTVTVGGTH
jgi:hypothetical protein